MKIKITKGCVAGMAAHSAGDEIEVSDREGCSLIAMGKAIKILEVKVKTEEKPIAAPKKKRSRKKSTLEE